MNVMSLTRLGLAMQSSIYQIGIIIITVIVVDYDDNNNNNNNKNIHPFLSKQAYKDFINIEKGGTWMEVAFLRSDT